MARELRRFSDSAVKLSSRVLSHTFNRADTLQSADIVSARQQPLSRYSSPSVPNAGWCSINFMLGAGMVIFQQNTHKIVLVYERKRKYWFLPRGRKDVGESLEETALREAYEEAGYNVEFLPHYGPTRQPVGPAERVTRTKALTEPIYLTITAWKDGAHTPYEAEGSKGGEYMTSWYLGQIAEDAIPVEGTRMPEEQHFETHLLSIEDALKKVYQDEVPVVTYAWDVYIKTMQVQKDLSDIAMKKSKEEDREEDDDNTVVDWLTDGSDARMVCLDFWLITDEWVAVNGIYD
ncbi:NUDIX hydrolase domain-like protein [Cyathus striatus]|nr:NUDIX hydrolase domain-like protein [Cyathus striatus]